MFLPSIKNLKLQGKRVFIRADLNVPLENGTIVQDYRLKCILPTINFILREGGKVILATHLGRPYPHTHALYDEALSTKHLVPWFKKQGFSIDFEKDLVAAHHKSKQFFNHILLLENLRFFNSEKEVNTNFAELLAFLGDIYINDAFAMIHRSDTSVTLLAQQFPPERRAFGLLAEKELTHFFNLRENTTDSLTLVIGGNKINDKIPMLHHFLNKENHPNLNTICLGGKLGLAFLKAEGYECGTTTIDEETVSIARTIFTTACEQGIKLVLPEDHLVSCKCSQDLLTVKTIEQIPHDGTCIDIGPKTIQSFSQEIEKAKMIFANGTMGIYEKPESAKGTQVILETIAKAGAFSVVGGGDVVAAAYQAGLQDKFSLLSTGGGATLAFLGCETPEKDLPALVAMFE